MNAHRLQDRLYLGLGKCANHTGRLADAFRPSGPFQPLDTQNRYMKLPAVFVSSAGGYSRANAYGNPLWYGIFDASYTRAGDYLTLESETFFIASQAPLMPVLCVKTNRTISIARPNMQSGIAANSYGGYTSGGSASLLDGWPASVLGENKSARSTTNLPTDQMVTYWNVLVASPPAVVLSPGDIITDDLGRTAVVAATELSDLGWRISAKMATT